MANDNVRYTLTIPAELHEGIVNYWHDKRLQSKNVAITNLINIGIKAVEEGRVIYVDKPAAEMSEDATWIAEQYDQLDSDLQYLAKTSTRNLARVQAKRSDNQGELGAE